MKKYWTEKKILASLEGVKNTRKDATALVQIAINVGAGPKIPNGKYKITKPLVCPEDFYP